MRYLSMVLVCYGIIALQLGWKFRRHVAAMLLVVGILTVAATNYTPAQQLPNVTLADESQAKTPLGLDPVTVPVEQLPDPGGAKNVITVGLNGRPLTRIPIDGFIVGGVGSKAELRTYAQSLQPYFKAELDKAVQWRDTLKKIRPQDVEGIERATKSANEALGRWRNNNEAMRP